MLLEPAVITQVERRSLGSDRWEVQFGLAVAGMEISGTLAVQMGGGVELTQEEALRVVHRNVERLVAIALQAGVALAN